MMDIVKKHLIRILILLAISSSLSFGSSAARTLVCEKHLAIAAKKYAVPLAVLYAVGLTESGWKGRLHPHALNVEGKTYFPKNVREAINVFSTARREGKVLIDLGCMQINHKYHRQEFGSLKAMLDPAKNVDYSARFLRRLKNRHGTWSVAVARYHAGGKNHAAQKKYVCRVLRHMIAQKLAKSTKTSKKVCNSID